MSFRESYAACLRILDVERDVGIPENEIVATEARLGVALPKALREFYLMTGTWDLNVAHNRLLALGDLRWLNDRLVFYEESEKLAYWGIARAQLTQADPIVAQGVKERGRTQWYDEELSCSSFLTMMTYWQTLVGGLGFAAVATTAGEWEEVGDEWSLQGNNGPMAIYAKQHSVLGVLYDAEDDVTSLHSAATDLAKLQAIAHEYPALEWEVILGDEEDEVD